MERVEPGSCQFVSQGHRLCILSQKNLTRGWVHGHDTGSGCSGLEKSNDNGRAGLGRGVEFGGGGPGKSLLGDLDGLLEGYGGVVGDLNGGRFGKRPGPREKVDSALVGALE